MATPMSFQKDSTTGPLAPGAPPTVQEFKIRVPKTVKKKYHVMRFNATLNVDFAKWSQVKMERENNLKEFKGFDEDQPKFGAGSEFGRDAREEARRKKFGIVARKYKPDDQPWILKTGGKSGKKFKGIREGGVSENAAYYVFTHAPDGAIDAYPLQEWYNFQPIQRYKALSAEEAEQEFGRRNKVMNFFSLMLRKRLKPDEEGDLEDPDETKTKKGGGKKELKISEMDEWMDSGDDSSESEEEKEKKEEDEDLPKKKGKGKKAEDAKKKKKKKSSDDEAFEESDDGDDEGKEMDYVSDSSDSDSDHEGKANKQLKSVAEEDALRKLLTSDEDSEDEEKKSADETDKDDEKEEKDKEAKERESKDKKESKHKKKKTKSKLKKDEKKESSSEMSSNSSDSESDIKKKPNKKNIKDNNSGNNSRSASPLSSISQLPNLGENKRKLPAASGFATSVAGTSVESGDTAPPVAKKQRLDVPVSQSFNLQSNDSGITEDAVRRYLMRKPMTTTELLTKFKSKKTGVSSEKLVEMMTQILKRINPVKQTIKGKMYLSIKA